MRSFPWPTRVRPSRVPEPRPRGRVSPQAWAVRLARLKARAVARTVREGLILGADTLVCHRGKIFGKPSSAASSRRMLARLSGTWHTVVTGLCLVARPGRREWSAAWSTRVHMRRLTPAQLDYWSVRNHDKAGGYAVQERGDPFVDRLRGDYDNVVGLPRKGVRRLLDKARRAGYAPIRRPGPPSGPGKT